MKRKTQKQKILEHLERNGSITTYEAFIDHGITKLTTRISELRKDGYEIQGEMVTGENRFGDKVHYNIYRLES